MDKINQDKNEILRYLGYKNQEIDNITDGLIYDSMEEIKSLIKARYIYKIFTINRDNNNLLLEGSKLYLMGNDIKNHLSKSQKCVLIGATLGHEVDTRIRYYEKSSITKALIFDACATVAIERICDNVCIEIEEKLNSANKALTYRFSPGYGDLPIDIQSDFLLTLGAKKSIGLTSSFHSILIPRKSVTAIAGIVDIKESKIEISCIDCNKYNTCMFSKEGKGCGY